MKTTSHRTGKKLNALSFGRWGMVALLAAVAGAMALHRASAFAKPPAGEEARDKAAKPAVVKPKMTPAYDPRVVGLEGDPRLKAAGRGDPANPTPVPNIKGPKSIIKPDEVTHDFGTTWVGPPLKHAFKITNEGDVPLEITKVKPACGCTVAGDYPKKIEPGQTGEFPFSIASTKLRGSYEKSITISSNDPATPDLRLKLRGEVKRYVEITPNSANFGRITTQEPQERMLSLTSNMDTPLQLTLTPPADSKFAFELIEKTPGKQFDLKVTANPPFTPGSLKSTLTIKTNVEAQKDITVDATGTVPQRLELQPTSVTVNKPKPEDAAAKEGLARQIRFTNSGKTPVKVLEATVDDPTVSVSVSERKAGETYNIQVQMPPGYQPPAQGAKITLKTDDAEQPTLTVPIMGAATPKTAERPQARPTDALVGKPAPSLSLQTLEGKPVSNAEFANAPATILNFFAPNCGYCKKQIPRLEPLRTTYVEKGVRFINVAQKMGTKEFSNDEIADLIKGLGFRGELAIDMANTTGPAFQANGFPTMVVVGKSGKIEALNIGNLGDLETRLTGQLDALIAGKPVPTFDAPTAAATDAADKPKPPVAGGPMNKPAPAFSLQTIEGKPVSSEELTKAPATVLNFFAPNCGYCKKQIPRLETIRATYADKGVRFVNVSQKMGAKEFSKDEVVEMMNGMGFKGELAIDHANTTGPLFSATGFPTMIVLGKSGKVEAMNVGNLADLETRMKDQLDAILAGKPVPATAAAPPPKRAAPEDLVGKPAPAFSLKTLEGKSLATADLATAPATVLNFFATNCGYCQKQIPRLETVRKSYAEKGVRFVNVAESMGSPPTEEQVVAKLKELGAELEVARDPENKVGPLFNATGFPTMVVLGKSGKIEAVNVGNIGDLEVRLRNQLDALIAGKPIPAPTPMAAATPPPTDPANPGAMPPTADLAKPAPPQRPAMELVGKPAPTFTIDTLEGKKLSSGDFAQHPATVLNFVAPNCGYCKKQLPTVEAIRAEYEAKGVRFVNVYQKMGAKEFTPEEATDVFKGAGSKLELARDADNKVGQMFKAVSYPTMVVVNKQGTIEHVNIGAKADLNVSLKAQLDGMISGKGGAMPPPNAPAAPAGDKKP